jgi:sphingolipid delta-4 desaturase
MIGKKNDFYWVNTGEPHSSRRKEILEKYPEIKKLYGIEPRTKYIVFFWVFSQLWIAYLLRDSSYWIILLCVYLYGAFANQALFLAMHEIGHNLVFDKPWKNSLLGCFANITTILPYFSLFQKYHQDHHTYLGVVGLDPDLPSEVEAFFFTNTFWKIIWIFLYPGFYLIRPLFRRPRKIGLTEFINWFIVGIVNIIVIYTMGYKSLAYLALSGIIGTGLHPVAGHLLAEHFMFEKGQDTYSYYGPFNIIGFNVGYHVEHHDFPRIPYSKLPELRKIAPEYYNNLKQHTSWVKVMWDFITTSTLGPYSRVTRKNR